MLAQVMLALWPGRARSILRRMAKGQSFKSADWATRHLYDTTGWHEVLSRMSRARGKALTAAVALARVGGKLNLTGDDITTIRQMTEQLGDLARQTKLFLGKFTARQASERKVRPKAPEELRLDHKKLTCTGLLGHLRGCQAFLSKCLRDMPLIKRRVGQFPTTEQHRRIVEEISRILGGTAAIELILDRGLLGGVQVPSEEGLDAQALRHAHQTLLRGRHALTIFPEGNVFLQNDILAPFNEGPAFLALKAAKEVAGQEARMLVVPVAIKATYIADVRQAVFDKVQQLAAAIEVELQNDHDPLTWLRLVGHGALRRNQRTRGLSTSTGGDPKAIIQQAVGDVLDRLERKVGLNAVETKSLLERICRVRRAIHQVRIDNDRKVDHSAAAVWADEALMAFKVASYLGNYVHRRPTLDRYAETVQKLDEDIHSHMPGPFGPRQAIVSFCAPIDVTEFLKGGRYSAQQLTSACEEAVQQELDRLLHANLGPGAALVAQPHEAEVMVE